jgi:uncharacterized membrane protein
MGKASRDKNERRQMLRRLSDVEKASRRDPLGGATGGQPQFVARFQGTVFQGPLPHPEILAGYDNVLPGAADRIISMAEKNQAHRHELEAKVIPAGILSERIGQILAFVLYLAALGSGTYLVASGKDTVGVVEMLGATATFAALYFKGQAEKKRELRGKRPE